MTLAGKVIAEIAKKGDMSDNMRGRLLAARDSLKLILKPAPADAGAVEDA